MPETPIVSLPLMVDASTGKPLYPEGDEISRPDGLPEIDYRTTVVFAVSFVDRTLASDLSWELSAHPLDAEKTYTLSGGCFRSPDPAPMFQSTGDGYNLPGDWPDGSDADPALGRLTFRLRTDDPHFAEIAGHGTLSKFCAMTVEVRSGVDAVVAARIPFRPINRTGESAGGSGGGQAGTTTLNGLSGAVVLVDADGEPLPVSGQTVTVETGGGPALIANPIADVPVIDATWGYCRYLDATFTRIAFVGRVRNLRRVRMEVVSANPAIIGTVVLVPVVNGVDGGPVTIDVGATPAEVVFDLSMTGTLALRRTGGTLADGGMVTCIVLDIVFEVDYAD